MSSGGLDQYKVNGGQTGTSVSVPNVSTLDTVGNRGVGLLGATRLAHVDGGLTGEGEFIVGVESVDEDSLGVLDLVHALSIDQATDNCKPYGQSSHMLR